MPDWGEALRVNIASLLEKSARSFGARPALALGTQVHADYGAFGEKVAAMAAGLIEAHDLTPLHSATNFVTIDCGRDGAYATAVLNALVARDIFVRMPWVAPLNRCIRISAGTDADLDLFEAALPNALADAT